MADRVDAPMDAVKVPSAESPGDCALVQTCSLELRNRDHAVLATRKPSDCNV